jgi:CBS domain-containing protein
MNALTHVDRETSVLEASKVMRISHSTELLVVDKSHGLPFVFGVLTALDIVTRVIATGLDPAVLTAGDIAWTGIAGRSSGP